MKKVGSIIIVGGGSAGWMTAAYVSNMLLGVEVTLIESPKIPSIGVGEATTPMITTFLAQLGFHAPDLWMPECQATFKTGILFENWHRKSDSYWHPFESLEYVTPQQHTGHCWLHRHADGNGGYGDKASFYERYFCSTTLNVKQNKMPFNSEVAYHFDAARFGKMLRSVARDVKHVLDDVVEIDLDEQGNISALVTKEHGRLTADLFVDCTGFRRQLITRVAPEQKFQSRANSLFNDRASVCHLEYDRDTSIENQMVPYVRATALSAGWVWTIPLFNRLSVGYVYSSNFLSDADADAELGAFCGRAAARSLSDFRVQFNTGKFPALWNKNCIAIGLAGGFVEPLESSGLAIAQVGIEMFTSMLDARFYDPVITERYNAYMDKMYTDIFNFITMHFCLTARDDTAYWNAVKNDTFIPPELEARFEVFRKYLPTGGTKGMRESVWAFRDISWFCVLLGMNFDFEIPKLTDAILERGAAIARDKRARTKELSAKLPSHYGYLATEVYKLARSQRPGS